MTSIRESLQGTETREISRGQQIFVGATASILVNIVVLNLFVQYFDRVVIDHFTISIFTAVLLTFMLWAITGVEHRVRHFFFDERTGRGSNVVGVLAVWAILFSSKFVILEVVDIVFGDHVELGKLVEVILLVVAMLVSSAALQRIYRALGPA